MFNAFVNLFSRFLARAWHQTNDRYLGGALREPVFNISETRRTLGSWHAPTRTLSISSDLLMNHAEHEILEVLRHEMAHQYADEVLGATDAGETPHGSGFRHACRMLDIHHHARMSPASEAPPILVRIRKLLALAESQNEHEAAVAMAKAKQLMARYELDISEEPDDFRYQFLGAPRKQKSAVEQMIAATLVRHFHLRVVWIPSSMLLTERRVWLLEACGSSANLDVASYVYDYLKRELEWLWRLHQRGNIHLKGKTPKREYQLGVLRGFMARLEEEQPEPSPGTELVLLKHARLLDFLQNRHPNLRSGKRMSWRETDAYKAGFAKGKELEIRKGMKRGKQSPMLEKNRLIGP